MLESRNENEGGDGMSAEEWVSEPWVEDENHKTINGERWVARECEGGCVGNGIPDCEWRLGCFHCTRQGYVRWYRSDSPALAFFENTLARVS